MPSILNDLMKQEKKLPNVCVSALAGSGKSACMVDLALNRIRGNELPFTPSEEQQAIIEAIAPEGYNPSSVLMVAFNKSIQKELDDRTPEDVTCKTMHSLGLSILRESFTLRRYNTISTYKVDNLIGEVLGIDSKKLRITRKVDYKAIKDLVGLVKVCLLPKEDWSPASFRSIIANYMIKVEDEQFVLQTCVAILERTLNFSQDLYVDFDDMIWLPVMLDLHCYKHDLVLVDESQDLSPLQQELCLRVAKRVVIVGDKNQSIYGFAGSDVNSIDNFIEQLDGETITLPMNQTRRCGWEIIYEAQKIVPSFTGADNVGEGFVGTLGFDDGEYRKKAEPGDMVICRVNAPLASQCLKFIKEGKKATIIGRDFGKQLVNIINSNYCDNFSEFIGNLDDWKKESLSKKLPDNTKIIIADQHACLVELANEISDMSSLQSHIESMFSDEEDNKAIRLSSIHKSKGLEADRVFFIRTKDAPCPHPMAQQDWAKQQENNLVYIGITRAIKEFYWVK